MDNQNTNQQTPNTQTTPNNPMDNNQMPPPQQSINQNSNNTPPNKPKNMIMVIGIIIAVIVLGIIGILYFMALRSYENSSMQTSPVQDGQQSTPSAENETVLEEANSIEIGSPESDLESIEQDLNQL